MASSPPTPKINLLLTGATGYIGGTILTQLLKSTHAEIRDLNIAVLVRDDDRAKKIADELGVKTYLMHDLSDHEAIVAAASQSDVVINAGAGYHPTAAKSHVEGLAKRQAQTGQPTYYIHTSGVSDISDRPLTDPTLDSQFKNPSSPHRDEPEGPTFVDHVADGSDNDNDSRTSVYKYMRLRENAQPYHQRTTALQAIETGLDQKVPTTVISSPTIYGFGSGMFNKTSVQVSLLMGVALKTGVASYVGNNNNTSSSTSSSNTEAKNVTEQGMAQWNYVHILDLGSLYELVVLDWITGRKRVPHGEDGVIFSSPGSRSLFTWKSVAEGIRKSGVDLGILNPEQNKMTKSLSIDDVSALDLWPGLDAQTVEAGFASNSRTKAVVGLTELGWEPTRLAEDWERNFAEEWMVVVKRAGLN